MSPTRRLAAILAADVVGYSRMMEADEAGTLAALMSRRSEILQPLVTKHRGRVVKLMGDGALVEFGSAVGAVSCAVELQDAMAAANEGLANDRRIILRIGINLGDVIVEGGDLYGDGVNIAARLEALAEPGRILVAQAVYNQVRGKLPNAFEDLGERALKNLSEPVRVYTVAAAPPAVRPAVPGEPAQETSIAVLPFVNMSGDPEQDYFADGLTEDIITALARISGFFVIARTSSFTYKGKSMNVKQIATDLGVRYVMEGSVRRGSDRLRVTAQLIDAATGHHIWAERYDRPLAELFDIQDEITQSVAASTQTHVHLTPQSQPIGNLTARDLVKKAIVRSHEFTREAYQEAAQLIEEAIRIDPSLPRAHVIRACVFISRMLTAEIPHDAANAACALELATKALHHAPNDEWAHYALGEALLVAGRLEEAVAEHQAGLEINPNSANILGALGSVLGYLGRSDEAIAACLRAMKLDPRNPFNFWRYYSMALAHFTGANYLEALEQSRRASRPRSFLRSGLIWAASAAALDMASEAESAVAYCLAQRPDLRVSNVIPAYMPRFGRKDDNERLLSLLRKAGLPD